MYLYSQSTVKENNLNLQRLETISGNSKYFAVSMTKALIISNSRSNGKTQPVVSREIDSESLEEPLDANRLDSCGHRADSAAEAVAGSTVRAGCKSVTSSLYEDTARPRGIIVYRTSSAVAEKPRDALCY